MGGDLTGEGDLIKDVLSVGGSTAIGGCGGFVIGKDGKITFSVALKGELSGELGVTIQKLLSLKGRVAVGGGAAGKITVDCGIDASENWGNLKMATSGLKKCLNADRPYKLGVEVSGSGAVEVGAGVKGTTEGGAGISGGLAAVGTVAFKGSVESGVSTGGLKSVIKSLSPSKFFAAGGWTGAGSWSIDVTMGAQASVGLKAAKEGQGIKVGGKATATATCLSYCSGTLQVENVKSWLAGRPVSLSGSCRGGIIDVISKCAKTSAVKPAEPPVVEPVDPVEPVEPVQPVQPIPPVVTPVRPIIRPGPPGACLGKMNPNVMAALECTATGWGKSVCTRLVKERERGARYRDLDDMTKVVRKAFGADVEKCAIKKGRTFMNWAWPAARCEKGRGQPSCKKPVVHLCQNQMSRAAQSCTAPRPLTIRPSGGGQTGAGTKTTEEPPGTPSGTESGGTESGGATETAGEIGYLTGDGIYMRKEPSKTAGIHVMLFKRPCKEFKVLEKSVTGGGLTWTKIEWQGKVGYIAAQHVALGSCPAR
ncbi:MAG: hypothetical protein HYY84_10000 [Deltaproteobacteria bacterium]|nr:hypothetical protein [Deltaproteobacteria bacterium]